VEMEIVSTLDVPKQIASFREKIKRRMEICWWWWSRGAVEMDSWIMDRDVVHLAQLQAPPQGESQALPPSVIHKTVVWREEERVVDPGWGYTCEHHIKRERLWRTAGWSLLASHLGSPSFICCDMPKTGEVAKTSTSDGDSDSNS